MRNKRFIDAWTFCYTNFGITSACPIYGHFSSSCKGVMPCAIKLIFMAFSRPTSRALSNGATHFGLRLIVTEILNEPRIFRGSMSVRIGSTASRPSLTKIVLFERA